MNKIGLVILNFLTYEDTLESIKTLDKTLVKNVDLEIYVVDNKSNSEKFKELQKNIQDMNIEFDITYITSSKNLGFAKGMNLGIDKARENGCNFVICSNNDIFYKDPISFKKFIDIYKMDTSIAVMGPKILDLNDENQNP